MPIFTGETAAAAEPHEALRGGLRGSKLSPAPAGTGSHEGAAGQYDSTTPEPENQPFRNCSHISTTRALRSAVSCPYACSEAADSGGGVIGSPNTISSGANR